MKEVSRNQSAYLLYPRTQTFDQNEKAYARKGDSAFWNTRWILEVTHAHTHTQKRFVNWWC